MARVVVFGTGQAAEVACYYLTHDSPHEVVAFAVDQDRIAFHTLLGLPVVPFEDLDRSHPPEDHELLIGVAYTRVNQLRAERFLDARSRGYRFVSYVSSRASVWPDLVLGEGSVVMEGATIQPFARIGEDVVIGPGASIGHHTIVGDHAYVASTANVSGYVVLDPYAFIGANATVRDGIRIGRSAVVGAGVAALVDVPERRLLAASRIAPHPLPSDKIPGL